MSCLSCSTTLLFDPCLVMCVLHVKPGTEMRLWFGLPGSYTSCLSKLQHVGDFERLDFAHPCPTLVRHKAHF